MTLLMSRDAKALFLLTLTRKAHSILLEQANLHLHVFERHALKTIDRELVR